ncbi:hypothetical protein [Gordonia rubripertincta]|uniref:Integral membrane protein n=1 Tax=Gordonia rubripertincta TaxID=36822 RepID=A0ABT4MUR4_GORRU|nr:hypothetical protein [Gordonia rubripertincta]MCZ4550752.1 hypothetical protein [Gordonia rubripertincta]
MGRRQMGRRQVVTTLTIGLALAGWTAFAGIYATFSRFAVSDTSCDGGKLRPSTFGVVYLIVVASMWMVPFMALVIRTRSVAAVVLVVVAAIVAAGVVATTLANPGEFCF